MRVVVDRDECEANGVCVGLAPDVFELDDDDNLTIHGEEVAPAHEAAVREAVNSCPKRALYLHER